MPLTKSGYTHVTAHTKQVIAGFKEDLRVKLAQAKHPEDATFWRRQYAAYADGAMRVWMSASAGLMDREDVYSIEKLVSSIAEE